MQKIALIAIFITAFAITANMHIYVQSLRISIYAWHIFVPVIPVQLFLALILGHLFILDRITRLYILWWTSFLLIIALSLLFVERGDEAVTLATRYFTVGLISLSFVMVVQTYKLATAAAIGIACASALAAGLSISEFLLPDFQTIVDQRYEHKYIKDSIGRVGGLYLNPNTNARLMALGMFVSCFFIPIKYRLTFCIFVGAAIFTTVSRSGILTWTIAIVLLTLLNQFASGKFFAKFMGFSLVGVLAIILSTGSIPTVLETFGLDELMSQNMTDRLSSDFVSQEDGSTEGRKALATHALEIYADNAIFGAGLGSSAELGGLGLGAHNTMLEIAAETGTIGLLVYLALFLIPIVAKSRNGMAFMLLYTFSSMFAHGLMNIPVLAFILPTGLVLLSRLDQRSSHYSSYSAIDVQESPTRMQS